MNPIDAIPAVVDAGPATAGPAQTLTFGEILAAAIDGTASAVARADALAGEMAVGKGNVAEAAVARAKADVLLEVASVAAARVGNAINTLFQTQV